MTQSPFCTLLNKTALEAMLYMFAIHTVKAVPSAINYTLLCIHCHKPLVVFCHILI